MKGCVCEKENFLTSYKDELSRVSTLHSDWSPHKVRVEVAEILRPRFRQDRATARMENSESADYEVPDEFMLMPDGRAYWKGYGRYMGELNSRTHNLTPDQYNPAEDLVTEAIELALRQGTKTIITAYPRPKNDIGDVLVISFDPKTNKGKMKVVNAAFDGKMHKQQEAVSMVAKRYENVITRTLDNSLLFVTDRNVPPETRPTKVQSTQRAAAQGTFPAIVNTSLETPYRVAKDIGSTVVSAGVFAMEALRRKRAQKQLHVKEVEKKKEQRTPLMIERRKQRKTKEKKVKKIIHQAIAFGSFAAETGVGVGGALFALRLVNQSEKTMKRRKKENPVDRKQSTQRKEIRRKGMARTEEKIPQEKKRKKRAKKVEQRGFTVEFLTKRKKQKEKKKLSRKQEKKPLSESKKEAVRKRKEWKVLITLAKRIHKGEIVVESGEKKRRRTREKKSVARFAFAWALWMFLHRKVLTTEPVKNSHILIDEGRKRRRETLVEKEPAIWVLFAIIWYLSAIRESRGAGSRFAGQRMPVSQKNQPKTKAQFSALPQQAVIFAFSS